jgi:hypothetical protein
VIVPGRPRRERPLARGELRTPAEPLRDEDIRAVHGAIDSDRRTVVNAAALPGERVGSIGRRLKSAPPVAEKTTRGRVFSAMAIA